MQQVLATVRKLEAVIAGTFLVLMVVLIFGGGVARMLGTPLNWTTDFATCLFAWACFLCADIAWRKNSLMSVDILTDRLPPAWQTACRMLNYTLIVAFLVFLIVMGIYLSWISRIRSFQGIPEISYSWVTMSLPVGAILLLITTWQKICRRIPRRARREPCRGCAVSAIMLIVLIAFTVLMLLGMPLAFAIGISGTLFFLQHPELPITIPIQLTVTETQNFALLAVPLFILAGNFLNNSGISHNLLKLATVLTGRMQGGLAQTSIALSTLMSGVTGSSIADAAMNARILGHQMLKRGFTRGYAAGVLSFGSLMAPIIPPGIGFILYGTVGQVSIGRLFAAGIVPGLMLWASLAIAISITARKRGYAPERDKAPTIKEIALASWGGIWAILFPIILLAGLRFGVFTPSEIGAFAVIYAVVIGFFAYRMMTAENLHRSGGRQPRRCRRGDVPARALRHLRLRHRVRAHPGGDLRMDARRHRRAASRHGDDRSLYSVRRHLHGRLGADHHADADLPAAGDQIRHRPGAFRPGLHHRRDHRQLHAARGRRDVRRLPGAALPDRRIYPRVAPVPVRGQSCDDPADLHAGDRAVRAGLAVRQGLR